MRFPASVKDLVGDYFLAYIGQIGYQLGDLYVIINELDMSFPVEEKFVEKAEQELGVRFPASFRLKMVAANGGEVAVGTDSFNLHPFFDTSDKKRVKRTCNNIVHETKYARRNFRLPENLVVIGCNGGGDTLVYRIGVNGILEATVYWLDHETDVLNHAADDFSDLEILD